MAIPLATTTITIRGRRPQEAIDPDAQGYDTDPDPTPTTDLATGVRASITIPSGSRANRDADELEFYSLRCDDVPDVGLTRYDIVVDESTGVEYRVGMVETSHPTSFGLEHIKATIYLTKGLRSGGVTFVPA